MGYWASTNISTNSDGGVVRYFYYINSDGTTDSDTYPSGNTGYAYVHNDANKTRGWTTVPGSYVPQASHNQDIAYYGTKSVKTDNHWYSHDLYMTMYVYVVGSYTKYLPAKIEVLSKTFNTESGLIVDIPFPYKPYTDTVFFITDQYGKFISERYYTRINSKQIQIKENCPLGIRTGNDIRFVFCHNHNNYTVLKKEINLTTTPGVLEYKFIPPYGDIVMLDYRTRVFFDRELLSYKNSNYKFSDRNNTIILDDDFLSNEPKDLDIVFFYTGHINTRTINYLPESGYIELKKHEINRNYNNNLMAVFINGKLIAKNNITDMTNNIHKINTDINTRFDLQVLNMSPEISSLVPYYKARYIENGTSRPKRNVKHEVYCRVDVGGYLSKKNRYYINELMNHFIPVDILDKYQDCYLSFVHKATDSISYTLKLYKDDYEKTPSEINLALMLRYKGNNEEDDEDSLTTILFGKIGPVVTNRPSDYAMFTANVSAIYDADYYRRKILSRPLDGLLCRFEGEPQTNTHKSTVYYELEATNYIKFNYIPVYEWIISREADGNGEILYRQSVNFLPFNTDEIEDEEE